MVKSYHLYTSVYEVTFSGYIDLSISIYIKRWEITQKLLGKDNGKQLEATKEDLVASGGFYYYICLELKQTNGKTCYLSTGIKTINSIVGSFFFAKWSKTAS